MSRVYEQGFDLTDNYEGKYIVDQPAGLKTIDQWIATVQGNSYTVRKAVELYDIVNDAGTVVYIPALLKTEGAKLYALSINGGRETFHIVTVEKNKGE